MSKADMVIQTITLLLCLWACWSKWGLPLWKRLNLRLPTFHNPFSAQRTISEGPELLTSLFLQEAAHAVQQPLHSGNVDLTVSEPIKLDEEDNDEFDPAQYDEQGDLDTDEEDEDLEEEDDDLSESEEVEADTSPPPSVPFKAPTSTSRPVHLRIATDVAVNAGSTGINAWQAWMGRVMQGAVHLIAIGQTGAGKTTVLQVFVEYLVAQGLPVVVCDPDAAAGDWPGTEIHGSGDNFPAINLALKAIQTEARTRREARAAGQRTFDPLWIVFDEYADIKDECPLAGTVVENLLRRARKLNIHLVIGVQDTQAKTMGFERRTSLLQNARIISIRLGADKQRIARVDDESPIRIPQLQPVQGVPTTEPAALPPIDESCDTVLDPDNDAPPIIASIEDKDQQIIAMLTAGRSYAEIATKLRVATTRISRVKKDFILE